MTRMLRRWAVTLVVGLALAACGRQESTQDTASDPYADTSGFGAPGDPRVTGGQIPPDQTQPVATAPSVPDTGTVAHGETPVGGNRGEVRAQLRSAASRLDQAVKAGQLQGAVTSAQRVRDLSVSLGSKTTGLPAANIQQIEGDIHAVTEIVEQLRLQAQGGNADGVKAQNDLLQPVVARLLRMTSA